MTAKNLSQYLAVENRVNTICKSLILGEADHFKVSFDVYEITITAFSHSLPTSKLIAALMRAYSEPTDTLKEEELENRNGKFWTVDLRIPLE